MRGAAHPVTPLRPPIKSKDRDQPAPSDVVMLKGLGVNRRSSELSASESDVLLMSACIGARLAGGASLLARGSTGDISNSFSFFFF